MKDKKSGEEVMHIFGQKKKGIDYEIRAAVYAVIFSKEKKMVLTVKNTEGMYFLPAGGMEKNVDDHSCLKRELLEETGYTIKIGTFIGHARQFFFSRNNEPLLGDGYFYFAELLDKNQEPVEEEHFVSSIEIEAVQKVLFHDYHRWAVREGLGR